MTIKRVAVRVEAVTKDRVRIVKNSREPFLPISVIGMSEAFPLSTLTSRIDLLLSDRLR